MNENITIINWGEINTTKFQTHARTHAHTHILSFTKANNQTDTTVTHYFVDNLQEANTLNMYTGDGSKIC